MDKYIDSLSKTILFKNIDRHIIEDLILNLNYRISDYMKDQTIAIQGDDCLSLGIILSGRLEIHKPFPSGKVVTINTFSAGNIFGEALVFSERHKYPATVVSISDSRVMYIDKMEVIRLMKKDERVLNNFVSVLSNRIFMLNDRITNLSYDTIRKKISNIIIMEYGKQNNHYLVLPFCRKKMAELLNIPRPSLSRELMKMKEEGLIDYHRNKLRILDLERLEKSLLE